MDQKSRLPIQTRKAEVAASDREARTVKMVWSTGARVKRYDWMNDRYYWEELSMDPKHIRMDRMNSGRTPILNTHSRYDLRDVMGVLDSASVANGEGTAEGRFSNRPDVEPYARDVFDGIIRNVSVGYATYKIERIPPEKDGDLWVYRAIDWEPQEVSLVPIGADASAAVRSENPSDPNIRTFECEFIDAAPAAITMRSDMSKDDKNPAGVNQQAAPAPDDAARRAAAEADAATARAAAEAAATAERQRVTTITSEARAVRMDQAFIDKLIADGTSLEAARAMIIAKLADASDKEPIRTAGVDIRTVQDETETQRAAMADAMLSRMLPSHKLSDAGKEYRFMSMIRLAEESLQMRGTRTRGMSASEIADRALHSTSDFPNILADTMNKRLRATYGEAQPTYRQWARRAPNAPDFRSMTVVQLSNHPDLLKVNEDGEFKYGKLFDGKEAYSVVTFGRIIGVTRQTMINDDLRALDRLATGYANAAARLENRTVYAILTDNAAMADGTALFHANHANYVEGAGTVLSETSLGAMRLAMRTQKGQQDELLNLIPSTIIVPAALEQTAYKLTSANYVPATQSNINEFRAGGKTAVTPVVEPLLDGVSATAWYALASNSQVDTVEYAYLDGNEGVALDSRIGFTVDGVEFKARLDFGAKAIDWRGMYKSKGAA